MGMFTYNSHSQRKFMGMSVKQWFKRKNLLDISHDMRYTVLVNTLGYGNIRKFIPFDYDQILTALKQDINLNTLPLREWEYAVGFDSRMGDIKLKRTNFVTLLNKIDITEFSCSECVCILKQCAKDWVFEKEYQKYQLQWMLDHDKSLDDLMKFMDEEHNGYECPTEMFRYFSYDSNGFNGSLWASYSEWLNNDFGIEYPPSNSPTIYTYI